jgi:hypothetical protein
MSNIYHIIARCELANYTSHVIPSLNHDCDHDQDFEELIRASPQLKRCTSSNRRVRGFLAAFELDIRVPVVLDGRYVFIMPNLLQPFSLSYWDTLGRSREKSKSFSFRISIFGRTYGISPRMGLGRNWLVANGIIKRTASTCSLRVMQSSFGCRRSLACSCFANKRDSGGGADNVGVLNRAVAQRHESVLLHCKA